MIFPTFAILVLAGIIGGIIGSLIAYCLKSVYYWFIDTFIEPTYEEQVRRNQNENKR